MAPVESKKYASPLDEVYEQVVGKPYAEPVAAANTYKPGALLDDILADLNQDSPITQQVSVPPSVQGSAAKDFLWSLFGRVLLQKWAVNSLFKYFNNELSTGIQKELPAYYNDYQRFSSGEKIDPSEPYPGQGYVDAMNKKFDSEITPRVMSVTSWLRDLFRRDSERVREKLWGDQ